MSKQSFFFSAATGIAVASSGAALAIPGVFDWSLFWVGSAIFALTLASSVLDHESGESDRVASRISAGRPSGS